MLWGWEVANETWKRSTFRCVIQMFGIVFAMGRVEGWEWGRGIWMVWG